MITEQALQEAIAECQGERNPNRNTCMMLAALYTIQDHLFPAKETSSVPSYSFAEPPNKMIQYSGAESVGEYGSSDFLQAIKGKDPAEMWKTIDELMDTLKMINERMYNSVMRKIR